MDATILEVWRPEKPAFHVRFSDKTSLFIIMTRPLTRPLKRRWHCINIYLLAYLFNVLSESPMSPTKPMRHILRSSSNTVTASGSGGASGPQDARLPPSGRPSVHGFANKMAAGPQSPPPIAEQNAFSGLISRAKEGLSSSSGRTFQKADVQEQQPAAMRVPEKSETELQWEEVEKNMSRALRVRTLVCGYM